MNKIIAVICDDIDGECVLATKDDFGDKHILVRQKVGEHKLPAKNLRGDVVSEKYSGWTDDQTLIITDLSQENLKKAQNLGYKIPQELFVPERKQKKKAA